MNNSISTIIPFDFDGREKKIIIQNILLSLILMIF